MGPQDQFLTKKVGFVKQIEQNMYLVDVGGDWDFVSICVGNVSTRRISIRVLTTFDFILKEKMQFWSLLEFAKHKILIDFIKSISIILS